jgi:hypothetical protein
MGNQASMYPKISGVSPDLSKTDEKVKNIISHFKNSTGTDMFTLKGEEFIQIVNALVQGGNIFKNTIVEPTQDGFRSLTGQSPQFSDPVYMYYFKKDSAGAAIAGGKSWWESLFGGGDTSKKTPNPETVAALVSSIEPAAGTATTPAGAVGGATTQPVTAAAPVPNWKSYASNLTNSATDALIAQGNANAGIPAPTVPPVVPPAA